MTDIFIKLVNMSISAGWLVLAVVLVRFILRKAPEWINPLLWGTVGVRLVLPISVESHLSLIPSAETISPSIIYDPTPTIHSGIAALNTAVNPIISESLAPNPGDSVNPLGVWIEVFAVVWMAGVIAILAYAVISALHLSHNMSEAVRYCGNVFMSERVYPPFVFGLIRPRIYIPYGLSESELTHITAHEQAHIKRRDHIIKPIAFLILALHWFNPLVWLAYVLLCRDIELACDEQVIRGLDREQRAEYSEILLSFSAKQRKITACPLAFGEVGVRERVKNVLSYKKPAFWVIIFALVLCIGVAVCFLTDPISDNTLTLDDVLRLSEKGDELTWSDFEEYSFTETGSGLYIRVYEIDEIFNLTIGGGSVQEKPMYIYLGVNEGSEFIDIRYDNVPKFINAHKYDIVRIYGFYESDDVIKTTVILFGSGEFRFTFSAFSSYIGIGKYEITDDRLILRTNDGQFIYTFDIIGDTIVFDAENSSEVLWYSNLYDGAVMK